MSSKHLSLRRMRKSSASYSVKTPTLHRDMRWDWHSVCFLMCDLYPRVLRISSGNTKMTWGIPLLALVILAIGLKRVCYYLTPALLSKQDRAIVMLALDGRN
jgi:hypothetical protein